MKKRQGFRFGLFLVTIGIVYGSQYKDTINATLAGISEEERVQIMVDATKRQPLVAE